MYVFNRSEQFYSFCLLQNDCFVKWTFFAKFNFSNFLGCNLPLRMHLSLIILKREIFNSYINLYHWRLCLCLRWSVSSMQTEFTPVHFFLSVLHVIEHVCGTSICSLFRTGAFCVDKTGWVRNGLFIMSFVPFSINLPPQSRVMKDVFSWINKPVVF